MKVDYVDKLGSDLTAVNAARVSVGKHHDEFDESDKKLLHFLIDNKHTSPFYHAQLQLRVTLPIFLARQFMRHTVGMSYNEISGRYVEFDETAYYKPEGWREAAPGVKQGSSDELLDRPAHNRASTAYETAVNVAFDTYNYLLSLGVCKEQARMVLPVSVETQFYVTGSLWAWLHFLELRLDQHAQLEMQLLAWQVYDIVNKHFPETVKAFKVMK